MEWIESYAEALATESGAAIGITEAEVEAVLDLARVVAHGTERRNAPLAAYLAGRYAATRAITGISPLEAISQAAAIATDHLGRPDE